MSQVQFKAEVKPGKAWDKRWIYRIYLSEEQKEEILSKIGNPEDIKEEFGEINFKTEVELVKFKKP